MSDICRLDCLLFLLFQTLCDVKKLHVEFVTFVYDYTKILSNVSV